MSKPSIRNRYAGPSAGLTPAGIQTPLKFLDFRVALQSKADPPLAEAPSLPGMTAQLSSH